MISLYFNSFSYVREKQPNRPDIFRLVQEASTLLLNGAPRELEIVGPNGTRHVVTQVRVDRDASGEDIGGWVYANKNPCKGMDGKYYHLIVTIIND
jgi:hypothetical protein